MHKKCSHCTAFMPTWKKLAVALADEDVRVVILDQRSNDVPTWYSGQTPMLLLVKKGQKQSDRPIMYTPGQQPTVDGMMEWLDSQGLGLSISSKSNKKRSDKGGSKDDL